MKFEVIGSVRVIDPKMVERALGPLPADMPNDSDPFNQGFNSAMQLVREEMASALIAALHGES